MRAVFPALAAGAVLASALGVYGLWGQRSPTTIEAIPAVVETTPVSLSAPLSRDGSRIDSTAADVRTVTRTAVVDYPTTSTPDPTLPVGTAKVVTPGVAGQATETWLQRVVAGEVTQEVRIASVVTVPPRAEVVAVGSKATATPTPIATRSTATATRTATTAPKTTSTPTPAKTTTAPTKVPTTTAPVPSAPTTTAPAGTNTCGASYYDTGTTTANGEAFNPDGLTAASKTLPFNTMVRVTNLANGKSVTVRINDRGPYVSGRCLDLARGAFSQIASLSSGVLTVSWQIV